MKEDIKGWKKSMGFNYIDRPDVDELEKIIKLSGKEASSMELSELDEAIMSLSNYFLFIEYTLGESDANIVFLKDKYDTSTLIKSANMTGGHLLERKALVAAKDEDIQKVAKAISIEEGKNRILFKVSHGIRTKLDILKRIYEKRIRFAK